MVDRTPERDEPFENGEGKANEDSKTAKSEDVDTADSTRDSKVATSKVTTGMSKYPYWLPSTNPYVSKDYQDVIHDRFQRARRDKTSSFKARVEDSVSGAASMFQSMFLGSAKQPVHESDNDRANRLIDELDAQFTPTLQSRSAAVDDQEKRQAGQRGWSWMKPW